jgi:Tol biopolymer transport system component
MGDVFRARDTKLGRDVAIKILPREFSADPGRMARFEREARVLASLNHPNIATIYGIEDAQGIPVIAMELVNGSTLAEMIGSAVTRTGRGLPLERTLAISAQLASALDVAHERGIVHRDLKPANLMVTHDGLLKVLDFGLAKVLEPAAGEDATNTASLTEPRTQSGVVMGTVAYMSPEQARGETVDKRCDIWAFGCVLFEMLAGTGAFAGATLSDTLVHVLERDPNWDALPADVPNPVRRVLTWCLEKDPKRRQRDIADAQRNLELPGDATSASVSSAHRRWLYAAAAAIVVPAIAGAGWFYSSRAREFDRASTSQLTRITYDAEYATEPALSPDGSLIVYASDGGTQGNLDLWAQRGAGSTPVRLTQDASDDHAPDFSPNGSTIAFRSEHAGGGVYVMSSLGGDPRLIAPGGRDPRFSPDGKRVVYWKGGPLGGTRQPSSMFVVPANGGAPEQLAADFAVARHPIWSPDGRGILFFGRRRDAAGENATRVDLYMEADTDFDWWWLPASGATATPTGIYPALLERGVTFRPDWDGDALPDTWGPDGIVFSATSGQAMNLWRVNIDTRSGRLDAAPVRLTNGGGADRFPSVDRSGRVVFRVSKSNESVFALTLDANTAQSGGAIERLATGWEFGVHRGSVSQDGHVLAYPRQRPNSSELWVKDLPSGTSRHLVSTTSTQLNPTVSSDGSQVAYTVVDGNHSAAYAIPSSGGAAATKICDGCAAHVWLPDGRVIVEQVVDRPRLQAIDVKTLVVEPVFNVEGEVTRVLPSANGRWIIVGGQNVAWLAPLSHGKAATPETSRTIALPHSDVIPSRVCGLSPDGRTLYSLLGLDGFRCLYRQRIDPLTGESADEPVLVHHFHNPGRVWGSTPMGNAVTQRGFIHDQMETSASIWLLEQQHAK